MQKKTLLYEPTLLTGDWQQLFKRAGYNCTPTLPQDEVGQLIRWGNLAGADTPGRTLNRKRALFNTLHRETAFNILKLNRIRRPEIVTPSPASNFPIVAKKYKPQTGLQDNLIFNHLEVLSAKADFYVQHINTIKNYRVWIFDAKPFYLEIKTPVKSNTSALTSADMNNYEPIPVNLDADSEKATHLAIKAVHLTGLDFAEARVGIDKRGRPIILDLNPFFSFHKIASTKFVDCLDDYLNKLNGPFTPKLLLGTDPEFILKNRLTGALVYPSAFLQKEGLFGYDERSERRRGELFPLVEIRPTPDPCPLRLMSKIKMALELGLKKIPYQNIEWLAGSIHFDRYQIGGHVHYSGIELSASFFRALDNYLGVIVSLIEDPTAAAARRKQYGGLGNIRFKPHGGFEYRTLGSWLVNPKIAKAVLCLSKVVALEHHNLRRDFLLSYWVQQAFYQVDRSLFYEIFPLLWEDLKKTETFKKYESELKVLKWMIDHHHTWDEQQDIRMTWNLAIPEKIFMVPEPSYRDNK